NGGQGAEIIPFTAPLRELEQEPTHREIEVLQLISEGLVNREIGKTLFLSEETVKSHVRHLLAKLQARSRAHAVAVGFRRGLLTLQPGPALASYSRFSTLCRQFSERRMPREAAASYFRSP